MNKEINTIPILEFFEDEGLMGKHNIFASQGNEITEKINYLQDNNIDTALMIFSRDMSMLIEKLNASDIREFHNFKNGSNINKIYVYKDKFLVATTPLGGPASGGLLENLGFLGISNFFVCGDAGQLDTDFDPSEFVLVKKAIRDEGTSYHYLPPATYVETSKRINSFIYSYLKRNGYKFQPATTWTTDAFYRETPMSIDRRIEQGAVCVEMECASLAAIAKFRGYELAQLLYFSDVVKKDAWSTFHPLRDELRLMVQKIMLDLVEEFLNAKQSNSIEEIDF